MSGETSEPTVTEALAEALRQMRDLIQGGWDGAVRLQTNSLAAEIYADKLFRRVDDALDRYDDVSEPVERKPAEWGPDDDKAEMYRLGWEAGRDAAREGGRWVPDEELDWWRQIVERLAGPDSDAEIDRLRRAAPDPVERQTPAYLAEPDR